MTQPGARDFDSLLQALDGDHHRVFGDVLVLNPSERIRGHGNRESPEEPDHPVHHIPDQARSPSHCSSLRTNRPRAALPVTGRGMPRPAPQPRPARWAVRRSGSAGTDRGQLIAVCLSRVLVTVSIPAEAISSGGRLGCGRGQHQRKAEIVAGQQLAVVGRLVRGRISGRPRQGQPEAALASTVPIP